MDPPFAYVDLFNEGTAYLDIINVSVVNTATLNVSANANFSYLSPFQILETDASKNIIGASLTNGQLLIGASGLAPVAATLTGTGHQIIVTPTSGAITLSTPQDIDVTSNVTFGSATLTTPLVISSGGTNSNVALVGNQTLVSLSGKIVEGGIMADGAIMIGSTIGKPLAAQITSTGGSLTITVGHNTINIDSVLINPINVVNANVTMSANKMYHGIMSSGVSKTFTLPTVPADGTSIQILDANNNWGNGTTSQTLAAGGPDRIVGSDITGSVATYTMNISSGWYKLVYQSNSDLWVLETNRNWYTYTLGNNNIFTGTNQFNQKITILPTSNQITLGNSSTGFTTTLNAASPTVSNRTYGLPDMLLDCDFVFTAGSQTITQKILTSSLAAASTAFTSVNVLADTQYRLIQRADGTFLWGSGSAVADVSLSRTGVSILTLNDGGGGQAILNCYGNMYIANSSNITSPTNTTVGKCFIYGSGTTDSGCDVLHVRQNTNTNPQEIWLGYNTTGGYGIIQSVNNNVAYTNLKLNPNGGRVYPGDGLILPNSSTSGTGNQTLLADFATAYTASFTFSCGSGAGGTSSNVTCTFLRLGNTIQMYIPSFSLTVGAVADFKIIASAAVNTNFSCNNDGSVGFVRVVNAGVNLAGYCYMASSVIQFFKFDNSNFNSGAVCGLQNNSFVQWFKF